MFMKIILFTILMAITTQIFSQIKYPDTKKVDQEDNSAETKAWVKEENKVTEDYLSKIPFRQKVRNRLEELWNYTKYGSPFKQGDYYYFYKNDGLQNQAVLYRQKGLD